MRSDFLSSLPPELICGILSQLDSPQHVFAIIRASPWIYTGAFMASREIVLCNVLQNAFQSTALSEARIAIRFLKVNTPLEKICGDYKYDDYKKSLILLAQLIKEVKTELQPGSIC